MVGLFPRLQDCPWIMAGQGWSPVFWFTVRTTVSNSAIRACARFLKAVLPSVGLHQDFTASYLYPKTPTKALLFTNGCKLLFLWEDVRCQCLILLSCWFPKLWKWKLFFIKSCSINCLPFLLWSALQCVVFIWSVGFPHCILLSRAPIYLLPNKPGPQVL